MINNLNNNLMGKVCPESYLSQSAAEPMEVFQLFFEYQNLQEHLRLLKQWKSIVIKATPFEANAVGDSFYHHQLMANLINAAWLLHQNHQSDANALKDLPLKAQAKFLNHECLKQRFYTKHLKTKELLDPYAGIAKCFDLLSLQDYQQQLCRWIKLVHEPHNGFIGRAEATLFYKNLRKLMECCWLIFERKMPATSQSNDQKATQTEEDTISATILTEFKRFLEVVPAKRLNMGLRKMFFDYLFYNKDGLPLDFETTLTDLGWLSDLLDEIEGKEVHPKFL